MDQNEAERLRIGATIKALREKDGWRLGKFAVAVEMSHAHLSNIEAGRRAATPESLRKIANTLRVPLAAIASGLDETDVA